MIGYAIRRLLMLVPVFFAVSIIIFLILHLVPGDPVDNLIRIGSSPEQRAIITARYGLDRSLPVQYAIWLGNLLRGDLGTAIVGQRPVSTMILQALPYSMALGGAALLFSTVVGIVLGVIAAWRREGWADQLIMGGVLLGSTMPTFWLGLLMILLFSVQLGWFPVSGARNWQSLVLPVLTVGLIELLFDRKRLQQVYKLRRVLSGLAETSGSAAGLELLADRLGKFRSNDEFLDEIAKAPSIEVQRRRRPSGTRPTIAM